MVVYIGNGTNMALNLEMIFSNLPCIHPSSLDPIFANQNLESLNCTPDLMETINSSFHFLFRYPYLTLLYFSSFHFRFHHPYIAPVQYPTIILLLEAQEVSGKSYVSNFPATLQLKVLFRGLGFSGLGFRICNLG